MSLSKILEERDGLLGGRSLVKKIGSKAPKNLAVLTNYVKSRIVWERKIATDCWEIF